LRATTNEPDGYILSALLRNGYSNLSEIYGVEFRWENHEKKEGYWGSAAQQEAEIEAMEAS